MTIEEAIEEFERAAKITWNGKPTANAKECQQMAEWLKDYKRLLEQEPCEVSQGLVKDSQGFSQEPCEDCISRQKVLDVIDAYKYLDGNDAIYRLKQWLNEQEPVQPKMGKWEWIFDVSEETPVSPEEIEYAGWGCSICHNPPDDICDWDDPNDPPTHKYCPNCGADMRGDANVNDK